MGLGAPPQPVDVIALAHAVPRRRGAALFASPLRYPGGKRKLASFIRLVTASNGLENGDYAEVFAGGAAVALSLMFGEYTRRIHINDIDAGVFAFWAAAKDQTEDLCRRIWDIPLTPEEWRRQRAVLDADTPDPLDLALATFYLNRTNRSGIIRGGMIGGVAQSGEWSLDARFHKPDLVRRIARIGRYRDRIRIYNLDAAIFLKTVATVLPARSLIYLDPPYYVQGQEELYASYYRPGDHAAVADLVNGLSHSWIVSYDDRPEIRALYASFRSLSYGISYSAQDRYAGREIAFFSNDLDLPEVDDPTKVGANLLGDDHARRPRPGRHGRDRASRAEPGA